MTMATLAPSPTTLAACEKPYIREKITHTALDIRPCIEQPHNQRSVFSQRLAAALNHRRHYDFMKAYFPTDKSEP